MAVDDITWSHAAALASQQPSKTTAHCILSQFLAAMRLVYWKYITKLLATGGSRVLDADIMLSKDRIVLVSASKEPLMFDMLAAILLTTLFFAKFPEGCS